jgi:hypothetical protein
MYHHLVGVLKTIIHFHLAILKDGRNMIGKKLYAVSPLNNTAVEVEIISSHYVDKEGTRVRS